MNRSSELERRIQRCREKLAVIDEALQRTLTLPFRQRPRTLVAFLWKERAVYAFALDELEGVRAAE